jgi:Flavodoxin-like fold
MYLLNIQSSPRRSRSASIAVADVFVETYRQVCPEVALDTLNVWEENLPEFDQEAIGAKYKGINKAQVYADNSNRRPDIKLRMDTNRHEYGPFSSHPFGACRALSEAADTSISCLMSYLRKSASILPKRISGLRLRCLIRG